MTADRARRQDGPRVLVAAGGTGGHVVPGLALARALVERVPGATVSFAGTSRGIETRVVPEAGFRLHLLPILPLSRRLALETVLAPGAAVAGTGAALRLLRRERIDVVAGMGGYVTLPVAAAARLAGVPVVLHESNAVPGLANRMAARFAQRVGVGVAAAVAAFPPGKAVLVGNPVRPELLRLDRATARAEALATFGLEPRRRTLFVFGGSQGARRINQALVAATAHWPEPGGMQVLHACGRRDEADVRAAWGAANPEARGLVVGVVPFVDRMDLAYAAADLAVTRAGAMTMAELTAVGMPAVMVPLPHATAGHQAANARAAAEAGGARVIADERLDGPTLAATAAPLLADPGELARMGKSMLALARPRAAEDMAALVLGALPAGRRPPQASADEADEIATTREFINWFGPERAPQRPAERPEAERPPARPGLGGERRRPADEPAPEPGADLGNTAEFEAWYRRERHDEPEDDG
jgi:UDP-N-acetylglucosamine--N-acetylmuramyl-(pentapeptide) pyrophosphoryl-undecaprenol N-acetylglucosamine transferase